MRFSGRGWRVGYRHHWHVIGQRRLKPLHAIDASHDLVVGISSNVIDPGLGNVALDGIGVYTEALERSLNALGVTTLRIGAPLARGGGWKRPVRTNAVFGMPLAWSVAWTLLTGRPALRAAQVEEAIDVYHCTDYLVPKLRHVPVVATVYDAIPLQHPEWANPRLRGVKNLLLRKAVLSADLVIAISAAAARDIGEAYAIPPDKIRIVPLGVDDDWFHAPTAIMGREGAASGLVPGYFLFVGTLQPRKDLPTLLAAYERLSRDVRSSHQLVIVGKYGWNVADVRAHLVSARGDGRILWLEHVERTTLRALYADAAALVLPSLCEGFGLPVLEALASGIPVVCSDLPVFREVAGDLASYAQAGDPASFAEAMTAVLGNLDDASRGRRRLHARGFAWRRTALGTLGVYREAVAMRGG